MARRAHSGRLTQLGSCQACLRSDVEVSWNAADSRWYCQDCWPLPAPKQGGGLSFSPDGGVRVTGELSDSDRRWISGLPAKRDLQSQREALYGVHIADGLRDEAFLVLCPEHGLIGERLPITRARALTHQHRLEHLRAEALDFPPAE